MTSMMRYQLDGIYDRGEPLAALFATESGIYGRFGYGVGSVHEWWAIEKPHNAYGSRYESPGRIVFVNPEDIGKELPDVFRRSTAGRPAVFQRASHHWERDSRDPIHSQGGAGGVFYAAYVEDDRIDGYVGYRTQRPTVIVNELMAATPEANAALWRFCFDLDLYERTEAVKRPVDDPMPWMLADPRRLQRSTRDGLWVRVVDARAALEQRTYASNDRLVLEIRDDFCEWNQGCWSLEMSPEGGDCRPVTGGADLAISVSALATVYLGAASFSTLQRAGMVDEATSGAVQRADRAFAVPLMPWTPYNF
jgi:predicted acetyltransferase